MARLFPWGRPFTWRCGRSLPLALAVYLAGSASAQTSQTIYSTGFEPSEGFDPALTLIGQGGWVGEGTGGNGLVSDFIEGLGQQAYIGFAPPDGQDGALNVWRPVNFDPPAGTSQFIRFSTLMMIVPTLNNHHDDFRWSVYNSDGFRLFSVDFETSSQQISFALDDDEFVGTGVFFDVDVPFELVIDMNFAANLWQARLNGTVVVSSQPITILGSALTLGDIDAVWVIREPGQPGDGFMVFDEYWITQESRELLPAVLEFIEFHPELGYRFHIFAQEGVTYEVQVTGDLRAASLGWNTLAEFEAPIGGHIIFEDPTALEYPLSFYQVVAVDMAASAF